jgi:lysyl endopeptidase
MRRVFFFALLISAGTSLLAQSENSAPAGGAFLFDGHASIDAAPAPQSSWADPDALARQIRNAAPRLTAQQRHRLGPLPDSSARELDARDSLQSSPDGRARVGVARSIPAAVEMKPGSDAGLLERSADGRVYWTTSISSEGAAALRAYLSNVVLPPDSRIFVYGRGGEVHGPYTNERWAAGGFWTNAVAGDELFVEVQLPQGSDVRAARLSIPRVGHLAPEKNASLTDMSDSGSCLVDVACVSDDDIPGVSKASRAVAQIVFEDAGLFFSCSGGLLNSSGGKGLPYFLTANHCVDSPAVASTVEAYWDYRNASCNGAAPSLSTVTRSLGARLVASGSRDAAEPDFALLQLNELPPPGRYFLGWTTDDYSVSGATIYRISHPDGSLQSISIHQISVAATPGVCAGLPQGNFIYSKNSSGSTRGGSSGAPAFILAGLRVVGQLFGRCGQNVADPCDAMNNSTIDGAFRAEYPALAPALSPSAQSGICQASTDTLCLFGDRFRATLTARDPRTGRTAVGRAMPQNDIFGYFSLPVLTGQIDNPEVFLKVIDARVVKGNFWLFYGGLTDLSYTLRVVDSVTGAVRTYSKPAGSFCGSADTTTF